MLRSSSHKTLRDATPSSNSKAIQAPAVLGLERACTGGSRNTFELFQVRKPLGTDDLLYKLLMTPGWTISIALSYYFVRATLRVLHKAE